jgi:hypothetical protein
MNDATSFSELWAKNDRGELVVAPCLSFALYLDETDLAQVLGFYQRAYESLRPNLTHYLAERMRQPAKITPRAEGMVASWCKRPNSDHEYRIFFWGGETLDISPWSIEIVLTHIPPSPARRTQFARNLEKLEKLRRDGQPEIEPSMHAVLPQVKRTAWLTFVNEVAIQFLGGVDKVRADLSDEPKIVLHPVAHGLGLQAGPAPELGDLSRHELIPLQRRVARTLRPVRLRSAPLAYREEFVRHWFNMFDDENPAADGDRQTSLKS